MPGSAAMAKPVRGVIMLPSELQEGNVSTRRRMSRGLVFAIEWYVAQPQECEGGWWKASSRTEVTAGIAGACWVGSGKESFSAGFLGKLAGLSAPEHPVSLS